MNNFILVRFNESREVIIDDAESGYMTGYVIEIEPGTHTISLAGPNNFTPTEQDIIPTGSSPINPSIVIFSTV
jgi:hypothetical protein